MGLLIGLGLLKFGNPVILASRIKPPTDFLEFAIAVWPLEWGQLLLALICVWGAVMAFVPGRATVPAPSRTGGRWLAWLPLGWLGWQCLSAMQTVSWPVTSATLKHFAAATACFYLGYLVLTKAPSLIPMWAGVLIGFIGVLAVGFDQQFGGLEATRKFFYSQPGWEQQPMDLIRKIASTRIYSTLFYPNTLAGVILMFLPILITIPLQIAPSRLRGVILAGVLGLGALACLYWSGSKAGWLIALVVGLAAWFTSRVKPRLKLAVGLAVAVLGLGLFLGRHSGYFERGASSMGARFDYWSSAVQIVKKHPILGSGPGTFGMLYRYLKSPESEMARMAHNDYLEQASDSGVVGCMLFSLFILGLLVVCGKRLVRSEDTLRKSIWLGLAGWAMQESVEFGLYIPALAWPAFLLLGYLAGQDQDRSRNEIDNHNPGQIG